MYDFCSGSLQTVLKKGREELAFQIEEETAEILGNRSTGEENKVFQPKSMKGTKENVVKDEIIYMPHSIFFNLVIF